MVQLIPPPLSLYIHFPWCVKKCPYCDFNSHKLMHNFDEDKYIDVLIKDLEKDVPLVWGRSVHSVFMGGGTPSLFSAKGINRLLNAVRMLLQCKPNMEITMEVNPGTGEYGNFLGYKQAGVNRLSLGMQSLNDVNLKALGRIHTSHQAIEVYYQARKSGFDNINLDMMFALPGQTLQAAEKDLTMLLELNPNHVSYYQLTIEENTLFAVKKPKKLPGNDLQDEMYIQGNNILSSCGFNQYEVSAYSHANRYCEHNINYWRFGDYLGIGAGAHSKITDANTNEVKRYMKYKLPKKYLSISNNYNQHIRTLREDDLLFEFMLNAVRLKENIKKRDFTVRTGINVDVLLKKLEPALNMKWVKNQQDTIEITMKGFLLSDEIVKILLD